MRARGRAAVLAASAALVLVTSVTGAQGTAVPLPIPSGALPTSPPAPPSPAGLASARVAPAAITSADSLGAAAAVVTVRAVPREFTIASVPVPSSLPADRPVEYTVRALGPAAIISRSHGILPGTSAHDTLPRALLVTFGIPARAAAGRAAVAEVTFTTDGPGRATATVAVAVEVTTVHALAVDLVQQAVGTRPGATITMRYRLTNQGNAVDTVRLTFGLPYDWRMRDGDTVTMVVPRNSVVRGESAVLVPNTATTGSYSVELHVRDRVGTTASERLFVEVPASRQLPTSHAIAVSTSVSSTTGSTGGGSALMALAFTGTLFQDVRLDVDATSAPALSERGRYRLSSLGQFPTPPNFTLSQGPRRLRLGGVGVSFSELTGQGAGGRGLSFGWESDRLSIKTALAGRELGMGSTSTLAGEGESPSVAGARVSTRVSPGLWLTGTLAHLDEGRVQYGRQLDVVGVGAILPTFFGGAFENEVALRRYSGGSGLGLFSEYTRTSARERVQVRLIEAPGGAQAYASANRALSGSVSHALSEQWQLGGQGWFTQNSTTTGERANSRGLAVSPQHYFSRSFSVGMDVGTSHQTLAARAASFGNDEEHVSATMNYVIGTQTGMSLGTSAARVTRGVNFDSSQTASALTSGRTGINAAISRGTEHFGSLLLTAQASKDDEFTVGLPRQNQLAARLDRFPLYFPGGSHLYATGIIQRLGWFGDRPAVTTLRGELTAELPYGFGLTFAADRNPLVSVAGAGPWTTALRVTRMNYLTVPSFLRGGARSGLVYQDLNGNGVQDAGEPGMPGVIIRRGDQFVTTDDDGTFRFEAAPEPHTERLRIDPRTLPAGWMERGTPIAEADARRVKAIGIIPTSAVRLRFTTRRDDLGAAGDIDLSRVVVTARDSLGRAYLAQPGDSGRQSFAALPPGSYQLTVDPSAAGAQLQVAQAPAGFRVGAERTGHDYEVVLSTRSVKLKTFGTTSAHDAPAAVPAVPARSPAPRLPRRSTSAVADTVIVDRPTAAPVPAASAAPAMTTPASRAVVRPTSRSTGSRIRPRARPFARPPSRDVSRAVTRAVTRTDSASHPLPSRP
jgi:hypothetical protein